MQQRQSGFSLMEVLICILVLSVGLLSLGRFQATLINDESLGKQRLEAVNLAQAKLESLRNFQVINTTTGSFAYQNIVTGSDSVSASSASYTRNWFVSTSTTPAYKTVTVTLSWTDQNGSAQTIKLASVICANDPAKEGKLIE